MRTKQVRPEKKEFEYELTISKEFDKLKEKNFVQFEFVTTKEFMNFQYKVVVYDKLDLEKNKIEFNIEGLSAPILSLSQTGIASYKYKLYDFNSKEYELVLLNHTKRKNLYRFKVLKKNIKIIKAPVSNKFIKVNTA
jgi:membrane-bound lytic murein transglycosylase